MAGVTKDLGTHSGNTFNISLLTADFPKTASQSAPESRLTFSKSLPITSEVASQETKTQKGKQNELCSFLNLCQRVTHST